MIRLVGIFERGALDWYNKGITTL